MELKELAEKSGVKVYSYHELLEEIKASGESRVTDYTEDLDTVFTISYTSGTSGNSKGVMLSNRNFLSAMMNIKAMCDQFKS